MGKQAIQLEDEENKAGQGITNHSELWLVEKKSSPINSDLYFQVKVLGWRAIRTLQLTYP